jgi:hypothetical protein
MTTATASTTVSKLFGTVATSADVITNTITTLGTGIEVLNVKSNAWLNDVKRTTLIETENNRVSALLEASRRNAELALEAKKFTEQSAFHKTAFEAAMTRYNDLLQNANL